MSTNIENLIKKTFSNEFNEVNFSEFSKELFNDSRIIEINPTEKEVWAEYVDYIEYFKDHGTYVDPNKSNIKILSVKLKKSSSRDRARVMQRNFVAKVLENSNFGDAAIVAFYGENQKDWRLSFVKMEYKFTDKSKLEKGLTPAKRYSYLVGPTEPSHTCKKQFFGVLVSKSNLYLKDLENTFSVEKVTDEFFEEYKNLFLRLKEEIDGFLESDAKIKSDFESKSISSIEFAKKLLGQIVFIYFLQKKGWLGIKREINGDFAPWGTGPKDFLKKLYDKEYIQYDKFFNDVLEPLFYEALSSKRDNDYFSLLKCKIPFLNGGLFEAIEGYDWNQINLNLSDDLFGDIITIFDRYNFTVKEDEPLDKEVAVDPEMLGKVFENLLDVIDRKSKGAFYTPREIVHYMCQQSLINYLETNTDLPKEDIEKYILMEGFSTSEDMLNLLELEKIYAQIKTEKLGSEKHLKLFKKQSEIISKTNIPGKIRSNIKEIDDLLKNVKIADPAVGSGAFPVGMMNEIIKARSLLTPFLIVRGLSKPEERTLYDLKRETIENSLYCVDIESSATDITKLRFWLSLVVDEENIENIRALPNLDHKIMCGNSLIDEFEGIKLFDESLIEEKLDVLEKDSKYLKLHQELDITSREYNEKSKQAQDHTKNQKWKELEKVSKDLEELDKLKRSIEKKIDKIKTKYRKGNFEEITLDELEKLKKSRLKLKELRKLQKEFFDENRKDEKKELWKKIENLEWELIEAKFIETGDSEKIIELKKMVKSKSKPFFMWKLYFYDVFNEGGFDIVIGNPPYVRQEKIKELKPALEKNYVTYTGTADLYIYFYEQGYNLLKENGVLSFITSNKWTKAKYGKKFREFLLNNTDISLYIDFNGVKVFKTATVDTSVMAFIKSAENNDFIYCDIGNDYNPDTLLEKYVKDNKISYEKADLDAEGFSFANPKELKIKKRIEEMGVPLKDWDIKINYGIKTGFNEAFIIDGKTKDEIISKDPEGAEIIKPVLRGRDIKRYDYDFADKWLIGTFPAKNIDIEKYPAIKEYLSSFGKKLEQTGENFSDEHGNKLKSRKKTTNNWFETQDQIAYWNEFEKEKIVWPMISNKYSMFCLVNGGMYLNNKCYLITGQNLKKISAVLNSKLAWYYFNKTESNLGNAGLEIRKEGVLTFPLFNLDQNDELEILVNYILYLKENSQKYKNTELAHAELSLEKIIDFIVYGLYFEEKMKKDNSYINEVIKNLVIEINDKMTNLEKEKIISEAYIKLKNSSLVQNALNSCSVEEVKIIEESFKN